MQKIQILKSIGPTQVFEKPKVVSLVFEGLIYFMHPLVNFCCLLETLEIKLGLKELVPLVETLTLEC